MRDRHTIEDLASNIQAAKSDIFSGAALSAAKLAILDVIGCAVAGAHEPAPAAFARWALTTLPSGPCSVWFSGASSHLLGAVTSNAAASSAMDGDDTHWPSWMHSGSAIVPTALAAAEMYGSSGREVLEAVVVGYEVTTRIAQAVDWPVMRQIATGHWCGFGAAATVARLRGASAEELANAFSVVAAHRPYVYSPADTLNLNGIKEGIPWGSTAGIAALDMAACGLTGPLHFLDDPLFDSTMISAPIGNRWNIEDVSIKPFASCAWPHAPSEALHRIMSEHSLSAGDITSVEVTTFPQALTYINNEPNPQTLEAAQYNIPFNVAVMALDGPKGLLPLRTSSLNRSEAVAFAELVQLVGSDEYGADLPEKHRVSVKVDTAKGQFECHLDSETSPTDMASLKPKYDLLTADGWADERRSRVESMVQAFDGGSIESLLSELRLPLRDAGGL